MIMDFDKDNNEHSQIQHNHGYDLKLANHEPTKLFCIPGGLEMLLISPNQQQMD